MSGVGLTVCGVTALVFMMSLIALRRYLVAVRESRQPG
jgi:hypothetical protein